MKKHGPAHRGAAMQNCCGRRQALDLGTPDELANWINGHRPVGNDRVTAGDAG